MRHPKIHNLSDHAFRVWVASLIYAQEFLTDGRIPASAVVDAVGLGVVARTEDIDELTAARLWERRGRDFVVHDYLVLNKSRKQVEAARAAARARMAKFRRDGGRS